MNGDAVFFFRWRRNLMATIAVIGLAASGAAADSETNRWAGVRDPFWPVGYAPLPPATEQDAAQAETIRQQLAWPTLKLTGLTRAGGDRYLAVVEGVGIVETGDVIEKEQDGIIFRWRVDNVTARGITTSRMETRIARGLQDQGQ